MRSYFGATESNTPRTRRAFSRQGTSSKPKWVRSLWLGSDTMFVCPVESEGPVEVAWAAQQSH